jgi:hypothetical protein
VKTKSLLLFLLITQCTTFFGQLEKIIHIGSTIYNCPLQANDSILIAGDSSRIMISRDNGDNWSRLDDFQNPHFTGITLTGNEITIVDINNYKGHIYTTKNYGIDWEKIDLGNWYIWNPLHVKTGDTIITRGKISLDKAKTWKSIDNGSNTCANGPCYNYASRNVYSQNARINDSKIYANMYIQIQYDSRRPSWYTEYGLHKSLDGGVTWTPLNMRSTVEYYSFNGYKGIDFNSRALFYSIEEGLYSSASDGENWKLILPKYLHYLKVDGDTIIGINEANIYFSKDQGLSWQINETALKNLSSPYAFAKNKDYIFFKSSNDVYRMALDSIIFNPIEFDLSQDSVSVQPLYDPNKLTSLSEISSTKSALIYPNPTNDVIYVNSEQLSKIEIIDMKGQILFSELNQNSVQLSSLKSGIYFVKVTLKNDEAVFEKIIKN